MTSCAAPGHDDEAPDVRRYPIVTHYVLDFLESER
jgi:hypothetical protein